MDPLNASAPAPGEPVHPWVKSPAPEGAGAARGPAVVAVLLAVVMLAAAGAGIYAIGDRVRWLTTEKTQGTFTPTSVEQPSRLRTNDSPSCHGRLTVDGRIAPGTFTLHQCRGDRAEVPVLRVEQSTIVEEDSAKPYVVAYGLIAVSLLLIGMATWMVVVAQRVVRHARRGAP